MAIVMDAQERQLGLSPVTDFDSPVGKGVVGTVDGLAIVSGSAKFLAEHSIAISALEKAADEQRKKAATVIFVGVAGRLAGFVAIADPIKATTPGALQALKAAGVRVVMLTGDGRTTAEAGDLMGIVRARTLSHATMRNIRQNLFLSFAYNVAGIPLAAGVLYPFFGLLLSPVVAAAAMALSSVSVIGNALRLRTVKVE
jgi:cation transport ATPase